MSKDGLMLAEFGLRSLLREVLSGLEEGGEPPAGTWQPDLEAVFDFALELCQGGYAEPGLMFVLFEEAIKALTADGASQGGPGGPDAEWVFAYIERHVEALGRGPIFERGKLILLRTCNQLLRRFSQTRRASLCGRILMLLSKMLGMSERSGVNLLGRVHSDNVTELDPEVLGGAAARAGAGAGAGAGAVAGGVEQVLLDREGLRIDVGLYRAVWGLQRVFSDPLRVLRPGSDYPWGKVKTDLGAVLKAFEGTPLGGGERRHARTWTTRMPRSTSRRPSFSSCRCGTLCSGGTFSCRPSSCCSASRGPGVTLRQRATRTWARRPGPRSTASGNGCYGRWNLPGRGARRSPNSCGASRSGRRSG